MPKVRKSPANAGLLTRYIDRLPPVVAREAVPKLLPGIISAQTLAHADSKGIGPAGALKMGKKVLYDTAELLAWLESHYGVSVRVGDGVSS